MADGQTVSKEMVELGMTGGWRGEEERRSEERR